MTSSEPLSQRMQVLCLLLALAAVLVPLELKYPYYFLQDDNRDYMLPWLVHNWRSLLGGEIPLYNFHQYSGLPSLGSASGALYPPGYVAVLLSGALFGHPFASVDHGYIQYFLYAAILEVLALAGIAWADATRRRPLFLYLSSWVYVALLSGRCCCRCGGRLKCPPFVRLVFP